MDLIHLLVYLLILCLIFGVVWWGINQIPLPPPVRVVVVVVMVLILVLVLLSVIGFIPGGYRISSLLTDVRMIT